MNDLTVEMPVSIRDMSLAELSEHLQRFGALQAYVNTVLSSLYAKEHWLKEETEQEISEQVATLKAEHGRGITIEAAKAKVIAEDEQLQESILELRRTVTLRKRTEALRDGYQTAREVLSRQIESYRLAREGHR